MVSVIDGGHDRGLWMVKRRLRRFWDDEEKRRIVMQTRLPGVSVSQVARRYDVNTNMVFTWLRDPRFKPPPDAPASFLPVEVLPAPAVVADHAVALDGQIEITLANGHRLSLRGSFDPDAVSRLVRGLTS
jgi:transposase